MDRRPATHRGRLPRRAAERRPNSRVTLNSDGDALNPIGCDAKRRHLRSRRIAAAVEAFAQGAEILALRSEILALRNQAPALLNHETLQPCDRLPQILMFVARGENGVGEFLDALVGKDQAVGDLLQAFEYRTEGIGHWTFFEEYILSEMDPRVAVLSRVRTQLTGLPALLEGVPRDALDRRVGRGWSVTENVAHLGRYHEVFIERVQRILLETEPAFDAYRAETDPEWPAWQAGSFEVVLQRLHAAREALVTILQDLTMDQWARAGRHARYGVLSLRGWTELFLVHEGHHLYVITRRARGLE